MGKPPPLPPRRGRTSPTDSPQTPDSPQPPPLPADYLAAHAAAPALPITVDYGIARYPVAKPASPRPGAVTAMGVTSLILGVLSILASLISFQPLVQLYGPAMSAATPSAPAARPAIPPPPLLAAPVIAPYDGDLKGDEGLGRVDAYTVAAAWEGVMRLPPDRQTMLRRLLREFGAKLFPSQQGRGLTAQAAVSALLEHGQLPAGPDGLRARGTHYFRTAAGSVLLDDAGARFVPTGGGRGVGIRNDMAVDASFVRRPCAAVVAEEIDRIRGIVGPAFNATQAAALAAHRRRPRTDAMVAQTGDRNLLEYFEPATDPRMVGTTLRADDRTYVMADGRILTDVTGLDPATGRRLTAAPSRRTPGPRSPVPGANFRASTGRLLLGSVLFDGLLGILLIVCGAAALRNAPQGMALHLRFAYLKFASVVFGVWLTARFVAELPAMPPRPPAPWSATPPPAGLSPAMMSMLDPTFVWVSTAVGVVLSLFYPVALLVLASKPTVRRHFAGLGGEFRFLPASWRRRGRPYPRWLGGRQGGRAVQILGGLAIAAAVGHALLWKLGDPFDAPGHVTPGLACAVTGVALLGFANRSRRAASAAGSALATAIVALIVLTAGPAAVAQSRPATSKPVGRVRAPSPAAAVDAVLAPPGLGPAERAKLLPADPAQHRAAVAELLRRAQGFRYFDPRSPDSRRLGGEPRERALPAWDVVLSLIESRDVALFELLNDPSETVYTEAAWALAGADPAQFPEGASAALHRAVPRLTEMVHHFHPRVYETALRLLSRAGDDGWAVIYPQLEQRLLNVRYLVMELLATDHRARLPDAQRQILEKYAGEILLELRMAPDAAADRIAAARALVRRLDGSPALAEIVNRLRANAPDAYEKTVKRMGPGWVPPPMNDLARARTRGAPPDRAGGRLGSDRGSFAGPRAADAPGEALAARIVADPKVADAATAADVRAAAVALCRRGPGALQKWAEEAVTGSPTVAARARRILEIAATAPAPEPNTILQYDPNSGRRFNDYGIHYKPPGADAVLLGDVWPRLLAERSYGSRSSVLRWVTENADFLSVGPETRHELREMSRRSNDPYLVLQVTSPSMRPPPVLHWAPAPAVATAAAAAPSPGPSLLRRVPWDGIVGALTTAVLVVAAVGAAAYAMLKPDASS